nr:MAG TPA: hypothetical protein [Bacteriophage sp.]DAZ51568.1 MAG TPA: hypothetical protein [Caudoviricetes sp.]
MFSLLNSSYHRSFIYSVIRFMCYFYIFPYCKRVLLKN